MIAALALVQRYHAHDQARFPLATLIIVASERPASQRARLLALAAREATARGIEL